ncbi:Heterokaryon incompatibility protein 6, OR allele [Fusarium oxysporum f. sp. rapae]|uniref:Heterokaryon incompatibility protein 6, OR allele n=1 Tax=Fusarium oxysporum f. sp. rapae TaxID=485398 RepID=A0A8J5PDP6_FUSOX|nr:Heterokaryon incompatibility protein 6, OR allele [Fusarium oxysporum f. sp. rapae]
MTKAIAVLLTLLGTAFAQIDRTCIDIAFNSETNTLSGKCQPRDNSGYIPSELDLNDCFGYDGTKITPTYHGNFAESCHGCEMFVAPDPWYGGAEYWIRCTCKGQSEKVAVPLEVAVAHETNTTKTRNMSSDHEINQIANSLSSATMTSQKSQKLKLEHLPVEFLFQISGELAKDPSSLSAQNCIESSVYSHALSHIYVPLYYLSYDYCAFRAAVRNADVEAMNRCAKYGGAQDTTWELPKYNGYEKGCQFIAERPHTQHRPVDELLESVYLGKVPIEKGIDALKWLLERHFDMKEQRGQACENADRYLSGITRKPLDVALRSHCPPHLLEVIIRDYTRRRVDFTTTYVDPPAFMKSWAGDYRFACDEYPVAQQWWKYTNLLETTWGLFLDLMDTSTSWEEQYRGEASDIFEQKIEILIKHHVLNEVEEDMLRSIVETMRSMNTPTKTSSTALADDFDAQCCWDTLYSALIPFKSMHDVYFYDSWSCIYGDEDTYGTSYRYHHFIIDSRWSPCEIYHDYRLQNDQIRPTLNPPWGSKGVEKRKDGNCMNCLRPPVMDKSYRYSNNYHIAIVAPLPEDYETVKALLDELEPEHHLINSGATCSLGKVGPHNVVLVGKTGNMLNVSVFVKATVDELLETFHSIRAGFLIGVDATAPEESLAKPGDIVVGFPQGSQPGHVQFDVDETTISNRISTTFEMSHPPSCIKSVINNLQSPEGRQQWGPYLTAQIPRVELAFRYDSEPFRLDASQANKVLCGKVASSTRLLPDRDLINKIGSDSKIMCFERAAADLELRLPFLTVCGIASSAGSTSSSKTDLSVISQERMATVIYAIFVLHRIDPAQLQEERAFIDLFQYEPFDLDQPGFRLVCLEKGSQPQVRCHLYQSHLDDIISYEALSYAWEGQDKSQEIIVDGKYLSITASLNDALFHLRKPDEDRVLWIDALCIDQNNIKERGHQVNRMGEIYKKAEKVVIWLGYINGSAIKLQSAINMFGRNLPLNAFREWSRDDNRWKDQWKEVEADLGSYRRSELVEGLQSLMEKPWFSRVWILQEVANAKRTIIGCNIGEIPGRIFSLLPHAMDVEVSEQCQAVLDIMPHPLRRSQNRNLCNLLWRFRGCKATDPRDRIYALLGMASDVENIGIRADYAMEEKAVIREFCGYLLGQGWEANLPAPAIEDLQSKLPSLSKELLLQKLKQGESADSLKQFLNRQGLMSEVDGSDVLDIIHYGSEITSPLLDRSRETVWMPREAALQCLRRHPNAFQVLLQRSNFKIEEMPIFIAQSMEDRPEFLERLLRLSSNPDQLRDDALMEAISRGCPPVSA